VLKRGTFPVGGENWPKPPYLRNVQDRQSLADREWGVAYTVVIIIRKFITRT